MMSAVNYPICHYPFQPLIGTTSKWSGLARVKQNTILLNISVYKQNIVISLILKRNIRTITHLSSKK